MAQNSTWEPSDITTNGSGEGDAPKRRGRIPQSAWPQILERHRAGATLSAIAREFDCTPSAISYIVRKAEAAATEGSGAPQGELPVEAGAVPTAPATEPAAAEPVAAEPTAAEPVSVPPQPTASRPILGLATPEPPAPEPRAEQPAAETPKPAPTVRVPRPTLRVAEPRPEPVAPEPPQPAPQPAPPQSATAPAASAPARGAEPVDAVEARLRDTARACLLAYRGWRTQPGEASIQTLSETVHELRKALARIEIDMSATRRDEQAQRPIPIPAHRAARRPNGSR